MLTSIYTDHMNPLHKFPGWLYCKKGLGKV
jgi:hypothetical protein